MTGDGFEMDRGEKVGTVPGMKQCFKIEQGRKKIINLANMVILVGDIIPSIIICKISEN